MGLLPPPTGNITRVIAAGREIPRDEPLDDLAPFDIVTDSGGRYRVSGGVPSEWGERVWVVEVVDTAGQLVQVGTVRRPRHRWLQWDAEYRFRRRGAVFDGGEQSDLWNAAQSLTV